MNPPLKINLRDAIGIALICAFISATITLFWKGIPRDNEQLLSYMLGQLSGFVSAIVAFHYVTKAGEKELEKARAENTKAAFSAIEAAANATPPASEGRPDIELAPGETATVGATEEEKP